MTEDKRPLVTLAVFTYNQREFVRAAMTAALAQTYAPLEVIVSDDCSTDDTFAAVEEVAATYTGPHQLRIMRAEYNQGIGEHVNKVAALARGELLVAAAGDDISSPTRVEALVATWSRYGRPTGSIYSAMQLIDAHGQPLNEVGAPPPDITIEEAVKTYLPGVQGCTHAWTPDLFATFGPILPDTICEDRVIPLRSMILGKVLYCPEVLVQYRQHAAGISQHGWCPADEVIARTRSIHERNLNILDNFIRDLDFASRHHRLGQVSWLGVARQAANEARRNVRAKVAFHAGGTGGKFSVICKIVLRNPILASKFLFALLAPELYRRRQQKNLRNNSG